MDLGGHGAASQSVDMGTRSELINPLVNQTQGLDVVPSIESQHINGAKGKLRKPLHSGLPHRSVEKELIISQQAILLDEKRNNHEILLYFYRALVRV